MSKISELSDGGSLQSTDYLIAVRSGGNVKVQADGNLSLGALTLTGLTVDTNTLHVDATNNRVGVGTTSPATALEVKGDGTSIQVSSADYDVALLGRRGSSGVDLDKGYMRLRDTGTTTVAIDSAGNTFFNGGNVGIGTSSPSAKLDVAETDSVTYSSSSVQGDLIISRKNSANTVNQVVGLQFDVTGWSGSTTGIAGISAIQTGSNASSAALAFQTRDSGTVAERMRIDSSGDIRLTGAAPNAEDAISAINFFNSSSSQNLASIIGKRTAGGTNYGSLIFNTTNGGTAAERMRITSAGNVGIGTSSPLSKLSVQGDGLTVRLDGTANTSRGIFLRNTGTGEGVFQTDGNMHFLQEDASKYMRFSTANAEAMRLDASGNLLVGTASGDFGSRITALSTTSYLFESRRTGTGSEGQMVFVNGNGAVGSIFTNGSATAYNTSSDYRLKNVDGPITNSGAYIDALKPVQGSWKADGSRFIGLIAHEVQEVSETPIATGEKDGEEMQGMDYSAPELIANLIAEIQSLRARVAQLEGA